MYIYNAQGKIEQFETKYYGVELPSIIEQENFIYQELPVPTPLPILQENPIQQELLLPLPYTSDILGKIYPETLTTKPPPEVPIGNLSYCELTTAKDQSELMARCGQCCEKEGKVLNRGLPINKSKNQCVCDKIVMQREPNRELIFQNDFLTNTNTAINYVDRATSADQCRDVCLRDDKCAFSMFTKQNLCYNSTADYRKAVKQERDGTTLDLKMIPKTIESVSSAKYVASSDTLKKMKPQMQNIGPKSLANCAQKCLNTAYCKYATGNSSGDCELTSLPIQNTNLISDVNSMTFVP